ncbi:hypothetical protein D3C75_812790 [compost metagenome]
MNLHAATVIGEQAHQVREQIIVANERCQRARLAVTHITDRHRLQRHFGVDGGGQQATMEGAQRTAIGGGAFREHQQWVGLFQMAGHLLADQLAVTRAATDEQAAGFGRQPAGHRPGAHFGLGQERQRREHAQQRNIGPGHMVADPEHRCLRQLAVDGHVKGQGVAQAGHEKARPALTAGHRMGQAQAFEHAEHTGHAQAQRHHHQHSRDSRVHPQPAHYTAALKCLA